MDLAIDRDLDLLNNFENSNIVIQCYCTSKSSAYDLDFMLILKIGKRDAVYSYFADHGDMLIIYYALRNSTAYTELI